MAGYQYEAFFSYKRDRESDAWHECVKTKLTYWVGRELGRDVRIFFDSEEIRTGMMWREKIVEAVRTSKCLICVWSPHYFRSQWCISEWKSFVAREKSTKRQLVVPASYIGRPTFPSEAKERQMTDFSPFTSTLPGFWNTTLAVDFEAQRLKPFASEIAALITNAPDFSPAFPIVEIPDGDIPPEPTIGRPADA